MALIPEDPTQQKALIVIVAALAIGYLFHWQWYSPKTEEADQMEQQLQVLEDHNRRAQILAARGGEELRARMEQYERHVSRLEQLIPEIEEVPTLLRQVTDLARQNDVEITATNPEAREPGEHYSRQTYTMQVVGSYHDVAEFMTAIASLPRIITPINLTLEEGSGFSEIYGIQWPIMVDFQIQTYVLPDQGVGAPAPGGQPASGG